MSNLHRKSRTLAESSLNIRPHSSNRNVPTSNPIRSPTPDSLSRKEIISSTNSPLTSSKFRNSKLTASKRQTSKEKDEAIALLTAEIVRLRGLLYERGYRDSGDDIQANQLEINDLINNHPEHLKLKTEKKRLEDENTVLRERINRSTISNPELESDYRNALRELEDAKQNIRDLEEANRVFSSNLNVSPVEQGANKSVRKSRLSAASVTQFDAGRIDEKDDEIAYLRSELQKKENQISDLITAFDTLEKQLEENKHSAPSIMVNKADDNKPRMSLRPSVRPSTLDAKENLKRSNLENANLQEALRSKDEEITQLKGILESTNQDSEIARLKHLLDQKDKEIDAIKRRERLSHLTPANRAFMIGLHEQQIKEMKEILENKLNDYQDFKRTGRQRPSSGYLEKSLLSVQEEEAKSLRRKLESQLREYESLKGYSLDREDEFLAKERELNELRGLLDDKLKEKDYTAKETQRINRVPNIKDAYEIEIQTLREALTDKVKDYEALKSQEIYEKAFLTESDHGRYEEIENLKRGIEERDVLILKLDENNKKLDFINKDLSYEISLLRQEKRNSMGKEEYNYKSQTISDEKDKKILFLTTELQRANDLVSRLEERIREKERESFQPTKSTDFDFVSKIDSLEFENSRMRRKLNEVEANKIAINITEADPVSLYNIILARDAEILDLERDFRRKISGLESQLEDTKRELSNQQRNSFNRISNESLQRKERELDEWEKALIRKEDYLKSRENQPLAPKKSILGIPNKTLDVVRGSKLYLSPVQAENDSVREKLNLKEDEREKIRRSINQKDNEMIQTRKSIRPGELYLLGEKERELEKMKADLEAKDREISELMQNLHQSSIQEVEEKPEDIRIEILMIIFMLSLEIERLKESNLRIPNESPELNRKLGEALDALSFEREKISQLQRENMRLKENLEDLENSNTDDLLRIKQELEEMKRSHFLNLGIDNSERKIERQTYELTIKQLREEIEHCQMRIQNIVTEKEILEKELRYKGPNISIELERSKAEVMNIKESLLRVEAEKSLYENQVKQLKSIVEGQEAEIDRMYSLLEERKVDNEKLLKELDSFRVKRGISEFTEHSYSRIADDNKNIISDLSPLDYYKEQSEKNKLATLDLNREIVKKFQELDELKHRYLTAINNLDTLERRISSK